MACSSRELEKAARHRAKRKALGLKVDPIKQRGYRQQYEAKFKAEHGISPSTAWKRANPDRARSLRRKYHRDGRYKSQQKRLNHERGVREKRACLEAYGGVLCVCCGVTELVFLTLDHVHGGGTKRRVKIRAEGSRNIYEYLRKKGYPKRPKLQVLCWNCNCGRDKNGGVCPHKEAA
jgi:hypothetical protein